VIECVIMRLCERGKDFNGNAADEGVCERACEFVCVCEREKVKTWVFMYG